jgi:phage shock protein C
MATKKLYRAADDKMVGGVLGGVGEYLDIDPTVLRLIFVLVLIFTGLLPGLLVYVIWWLVVPEAKNKL